MSFLYVESQLLTWLWPINSDDRSTHRKPLNLYHKAMPFTLLVNSQPSTSYGLPFSLKLMASLGLCQLINFGYSAYLLPLI